MTLAVVLMLVMLAGLGAFILFDGDAKDAAVSSQEAPHPSEASSPKGTPDVDKPGVDKKATATQMVDFVNGYFATMPGGTDKGWTQLAPRMQAAVGRGSYNGFWGSIREVRVASASAHPKDRTVSIDITYTRADGSVSRESQLLTLQRRGGVLLIASDEVLRS